MSSENVTVLYSCSIELVADIIALHDIWNTLAELETVRIVTGLRANGPENRGSVAGNDKSMPILQNVNTHFGTHPASY